MRTATPEKAGFSTERLARLSAMLQGYVTRGDLAGVCAIAARKGVTFFEQSYGLRDMAANLPMTGDTILRIASMTKPITAAAAILLYEEGHFHLNTPISAFLPAFKDTKVFLREGPDGSPQLEDQKTPLTFRHLFTHTSGISYGGNPAHPVDRLYQKALPANLWYAREYAAVGPFIDQLAALPLAFQPGARFHYGLNLDVLGRLVEVISGKPLDVFMRQRIFEPLGMLDTGFDLPEEKRQRLAEVYAKSPDNSQLVPSPMPVPFAAAMWGGGGLLSTRDDYARFTAMLANNGELDGVRLLSPASVALFSRNLAPTESLPSFRVFDPVGLSGYGFSLGTGVLIDPGQAATYGNPGEFYWGGAFSTYFWVDPQESLYGVLMTQFNPNQAYPIHHQFKALTYQALLG